MNLLISIFKKTLKCKTLYLLLWCFICFAICFVYFNSVTKDARTAKVSNRTSPQSFHVLCLLVPYRDRFEELIEFVPHMSKFLNRQSLEYRIIFINHLPDEYRFNKGASLNAGFHIIGEKFPQCDYIALQDVDTLPLTDEVSYAYPGYAVYHGIPPGYHPIQLYAYDDYVGGIVLMSNEVYIRMNGFGNNFWGWGFDDIDFKSRMAKYSIPLIRPEIRSTEPSNSFKHIHGKTKTRDAFWCLNQGAASFDPDQTDRTGLSNVDFTLVSENHMHVDGFPFYLFNINIGCIFQQTPWCKPYCLENTTVLKSIWEWNTQLDDKTKDSFGKLIDLWASPGRNTMVWNRILDEASSSNEKK